MGETVGGGLTSSQAASLRAQGGWENARAEEKTAPVSLDDRDHAGFDVVPQRNTKGGVVARLLTFVFGA